MCAVVSSTLPQIHVVSPVYSIHFFICALLQVYTMRRPLGNSMWSMNCRNILPSLCNG